MLSNPSLGFASFALREGARGLTAVNHSTETALKALVAHAAKLTQYGFTGHALGAGLGFHAARGDADQWEILFELPDDKERDATLLTLRLFLLRREAYSLYNLEHLASDEGLTAEFRANLVRLQRSFLQYLAMHPSQIEPGFFEIDAHPTRGEILDTVLNAAMFHTDDSPKRRRYEIWSHDQIRASVLFQAFTRIVVALLGLIEQAAVLTTVELDIPGNVAGAAQ